MASLDRPRAAVRAAAVLATKVSNARRDAELVRASGFLDREWLELQLGEHYYDDGDAVRAFLASSARVSPHPLFEIDWIDPAHLFEDRGLNQVVWYLTDESARRLAPHPLLDVQRIERTVTGAADHPQGPVSAWLAQAAPDSILPSPPTVPETTLRAFRASALEAMKSHIEETAPLRTRRLATVFVEAPETLPPVGETAMPVVSIIMPAWNRAHLLRTAIASVQAQTWGSWELLVVDDGSEDDTQAVLQGISAFDDRVRALHVEHGGVSRARNKGIAHARGRYVAFLDSDNLWRPDYLRVMLEHLEAHTWRMAHSVLAMEREGQSVYRVLEGKRADLLVGNYVDLNVLVVETDLLKEVGGFDETLRRAVDYDLILKLADHSDLHLVDYVGTDYSENPEDRHRISVHEPVSWLSVVLGRHLVEWDRLAAAQPVAGRISVVLPTRGNLARSVDWIKATAPPASAETPEDGKVELVIAATRARRSHRLVVEELAALYPHVRVKTIIADVNPTLTAVLGGSEATGEHLVFVRPHVQMTRSDILALVEPLDDPTVAVTQPVVVDPLGMVASAGAVFGGATRPEAFLAGHAISDVQAVGPTDIPAPFSPVIATPRRLFVELHGFDPHFENALVEVEYGIRASGRSVVQPSALAKIPTSDVTRLRPFVAAATLLETKFPRAPVGSASAWSAMGFEVLRHHNVAITARGRRHKPGPNDPVFLYPKALVRARGGAARLEVHEGLPQLRWTVDLASPTGRRGESWGDTHFARSLASALRDRGQTVAVDSRELRHRPSRDLDDILLVLRGLDAGQPRPGLLNIEWIISHPDLVTREEASEFDLVYAAGVPWAREHERAWDLEIRPLLQCTDRHRFHPALMDAADEGPDHLFVGNSRKVYRTSVRAALEAGVDLTIYGAGWDPFVPSERIAGTYVPNSELGRLYAASGVVLNDHWDDMRRDGFLSNRLFDAAASGARIVSDEIEGLGDIFGGQVRCFSDTQDIAPLLRSPDLHFPSRDDRRRLADRVVADHSFDARADVLLRDAVDALSRRRNELG